MIWVIFNIDEGATNSDATAELEKVAGSLEYFDDRGRAAEVETFGVDEDQDGVDDDD